MSAVHALGKAADTLSGGTETTANEARIRVLEGQNEVLEFVAKGASLDRSLHRLAVVIERLFEGAVCVVSLVDTGGSHLRSAVSPNLPEAWKCIVEKLEIRPDVEPCGAAAHRREPIVVVDVATDPLWTSFRQISLPLGLRACWIQPILDLDGETLGTVSLYFREPRAPGIDDFRAIDSIFPLARIAIEHDRRAQALKRADERFTSLAANVPGVVYQRLVTPDGDIRYTYISEGARDLFGVSPAQIVADPKALFECHGAEYRETFRERLLAASRTLTMWDVEAPIIARDGTHKWSHAIARPTRQADGSVLWNGIILDATRLKMANLELAAANRAKSEFLANMSHELRTPLNAVIGFSDIIKAETFGPVGSPKYRDYADDINSSGLHLLNIINDILDLAKIEAGKGELDEENLYIDELIGSVHTLVKGSQEKKGIKLVIDTAEGLPVLRADERRLKQILVNILSNAIKFTEAGGRVTWKTWYIAGSGLVFQIADTGIGIALDDIPKVLAPFGQVESVYDRENHGTGLGLPLTKSLVEMHGGALDLQSEVGVGTTVTIRLPPTRIVASMDNSDSLDVEHRAAS